MIHKLSKRAAAILLPSLISGCSVIPDAVWPPSQESCIEAVYVFDDHGSRLVPVPSSSEGLTILQLESDLDVQERFVNGRRHWLAPNGSGSMRLSCRYRVWGELDADEPFAGAPKAEDLFPGASIVNVDCTP